jgi:hypothetical protein
VIRMIGKRPLRSGIPPSWFEIRRGIAFLSATCSATILP